MIKCLNLIKSELYSTIMASQELVFGTCICCGGQVKLNITKIGDNVYLFDYRCFGEGKHCKNTKENDICSEQCQKRCKKLKAIQSKKDEQIENIFQTFSKMVKEGKQILFMLNSGYEVSIRVYNRIANFCIEGHAFCGLDPYCLEKNLMGLMVWGYSEIPHKESDYFFSKKPTKELLFQGEKYGN